MDDVTHKSLTVAPSWHKTTHVTESGTTTDALSLKESGCDPMEAPSIGVGTENNNDTVSSEGVVISEQTIQLFLTALDESSSLRASLDRLAEFHKHDEARLQPVRTSQLAMLSSESLPVLSMCCGSAGRVVVLLSESSHDSWCSHQAKAIVQHRSKVSVFPLSECACSAVWSSQGTLAVGSLSGQILLYSGETLLSTNDVHSLSVTSMNWFNATHLISCSSDGQVTMSQLKGTTLNTVKSVRLSVVDLPRRIRKHGSSSKPLAIVDMSRCGNELLITSETGGIWRVSLPDLVVSGLPSQPQAIHRVLYCKQYVAVASDNETLRILQSDGTPSDELPMQASSLLSCSSLIIAADYETIMVYDPDEKKVLATEKIAHKAITTTTQDELMVLTHNNQLVTYRIIKT